ncbi:MAG TPA: response regulator, partial [Rhizomicrobium sp.]|nr:response regulator [Rhizomicrobium sp.]
MSKLSFDSVDVLIYDPVPSNRTATRAAMYALGFRKTETVSTLEAFLESVQKAPPDIALCEAQGGAEDLCVVIQQLRQGGAGHNPFIVIIVTAWEKNTAMINRVVSSGADDLLLRPFSTAVLGSRIETHVERRKGFVITTDYVGPDRRNPAQPRANSAASFEPPNSLKMKAKEKLPADAIAKRLDAELKQAREKLHSEKLRRDSFQVCILWRLMQEQRPGAPQLSVDLEKLSLL